MYIFIQYQKRKETHRKWGHRWVVLKRKWHSKTSHSSFCFTGSDVTPRFPPLPPTRKWCRSSPRQEEKKQDMDSANSLGDRKWPHGGRQEVPLHVVIGQSGVDDSSSYWRTGVEWEEPTQHWACRVGNKITVNTEYHLFVVRLQCNCCCWFDKWDVMLFTEIFPYGQTDGYLFRTPPSAKPVWVCGGVVDSHPCPSLVGSWPVQLGSRPRL